MLGPVLQRRLQGFVRPLVLLHIGKTGGMSVKRLLADLDPSMQQRLGVARTPRPLGHGESRLEDWAVRHRHRRFAFVFREPAVRYASGFASRMRQGRPLKEAGSVRWTGGEAAAFAFFASANDCFEALDARDERLRSAALFAVQAITHVVQDHEFYLGRPEDWPARSPRAYFFCPLDDLAVQVHRFVVPGEDFDAEGVRSLLPHLHRDPGGGSDLSDRAIRNLRHLRPSEFELHARLLDDYRTRFAS